MPDSRLWRGLLFPSLMGLEFKEPQFPYPAFRHKSTPGTGGPASKEEPQVLSLESKPNKQSGMYTSGKNRSQVESIGRAVTSSGAYIMIKVQKWMKWVPQVSTEICLGPQSHGDLTSCRSVTRPFILPQTAQLLPSQPSIEVFTTPFTSYKPPWRPMALAACLKLHYIVFEALKKRFLFILSVSVCAPCASSTLRAQKRRLDAVELELQTIVSTVGC